MKIFYLLFILSISSLSYADYDTGSFNIVQPDGFIDRVHNESDYTSSRLDLVEEEVLDQEMREKEQLEDTGTFLD
jgi:hypothetical protein